MQGTTRSVSKATCGIDHGDTPLVDGARAPPGGVTMLRRVVTRAPTTARQPPTSRRVIASEIGEVECAVLALLLQPNLSHATLWHIGRTPDFDGDRCLIVDGRPPYDRCGERPRNRQREDAHPLLRQRVSGGQARDGCCRRRWRYANNVTARKEAAVSGRARGVTGDAAISRLEARRSLRAVIGRSLARRVAARAPSRRRAPWPDDCRRRRLEPCANCVALFAIACDRRGVNADELASTAGIARPTVSSRLRD